MTLLESKLIDLVLDLHARYGGAQPRPNGNVIQFSVVDNDTTQPKAVADTLLDLARVGKDKTRPTVSGVKRKDLAEMSGLTIETTVRLLKDFEKRALLRKLGKDLIIIDEPNLRSLAERF